MTVHLVTRDQPPVLDSAVLPKLGSALGDRLVALRMVRRFIDLLPVRVRHLDAALADADADRALDVALSIKVTAATVGGRVLQCAAREVEMSVRAGQWERAVAQAVPVRQACAPLTRELRALLREMS